ncbi:hypothetical protein [Maribellus sp. YY47]|uniref:hypothetical protein n=1 Tax=Maribellus sp. YY47 TaxID=2929486 RepID=UPI0020016D5D|nr:hypothetical protein [Maribellus sp. YY47]MCK3685500.1 hypothetical protein [Maribellus sp. YY47]MCK3685502.1 hypothetical protein [Maribellus sp. YY47]
MKNKATQNHSERDLNQDITRKEALKKAGKYAAVTAASMLIVLSPKESQATSPSAPTPWPGGF